MEKLIDYKAYCNCKTELNELLLSHALLNNQSAKATVYIVIVVVVHSFCG